MQTSFFGLLHNNNDACIPPPIRICWNVVGIADTLKEMGQRDYRPILSSNYLPFQIRADVIKWRIGNVYF
jgi:hypothetical protein